MKRSSSAASFTSARPRGSSNRRIYALLVDGDFRDWAEVNAWAKKIALAQRPLPV
jgi:hypothetical protein